MRFFLSLGRKDRLVWITSGFNLFRFRRRLLETCCLKPKIEVMSHNVQYVGIHEYSFVVAACFENLPIQNRTVRALNGVRVRADYKDYITDETFLSVFPSVWVEDESDLACMRPGKPHYATIAMSIEGVWSAAEVIVDHKIWGTQYDLRSHRLPVGDLEAVITLIDDRGISVDPQRFHLSIETNGTATVSHLSRVSW